MAEESFDFLFYDKHYRLQRSKFTSPAPWSYPNQPLHNHVMRKGKLQKPAQPFWTESGSSGYQGGTQSQIQKGFCFAFHRSGRRCTESQCKYSHDCPKCGATRSHPAFLCRGGKPYDKNEKDDVPRAKQGYKQKGYNSDKFKKP